MNQSAPRWVDSVSSYASDSAVGKVRLNGWRLTSRSSIPGGRPKLLRQPGTTGCRLEPNDLGGPVASKVGVDHHLRYEVTEGDHDPEVRSVGRLEGGPLVVSESVDEWRDLVQQDVGGRRSTGCQGAGSSPATEIARRSTET